MCAGVVSEHALSTSLFALYAVSFDGNVLSSTAMAHWNLRAYPCFHSTAKCRRMPTSTRLPSAIAGRTNQAGDFLSRDTACYPDQLASAFADIVFPLFSNDLGNISWDSRSAIIPIKAIDAFPYSVEDGGGLNSEPNWNKSDRAIPDSFKPLRQQWLNVIITSRLDKKLMAACQVGSL